MNKSFLIKEESENTRLDRWLRRNVINIPQSLIEKSIRKGNIKVNNKKHKSSYRLKNNDKISITNINFTSVLSNKKKQIYRATKKDLSNTNSIFIENNENFVVINKPAGISVQSGTKSKKNILDILKSTKEFFGASPYSVHRIDKETTGLLIVAKNRKYAQLFTSLFRIRKIHKTYLGIVVGEVLNKKGTFIDDLITYESEKKIKSRAITHYKLLDSNNNYSLLKLNPETGRKHQIRKQLLIHGYPILGDSKYRIISNNKNLKSTLMLHAYQINFSINGIKHKYSASPSIEFNKALSQKYLKIS